MQLNSANKEWTATGLPIAPSMKSAKMALRKSGDGKWKTAKQPGNGTTWSVMRCNAHLDCAHFRAIKKVGAALFCIFEKGLHTVEPTLKRRANSILNWDDETALRSGVTMGNTPGQVHVSLSKEETKRLKAAGEDILKHKRDEGGYKGAQTHRPYVSYVHSACIPSASHWRPEEAVSRMYPVLYLVPGNKFQYPECIPYAFQYVSCMEAEYCILINLGLYFKRIPDESCTEIRTCILYVFRMHLLCIPCVSQTRNARNSILSVFCLYPGPSSRIQYPYRISRSS